MWRPLAGVRLPCWQDDHNGSGAAIPLRKLCRPTAVRSKSASHPFYRQRLHTQPPRPSPLQLLGWQQMSLPGKHLCPARRQFLCAMLFAGLLDWVLLRVATPASDWYTELNTSKGTEI